MSAADDVDRPVATDDPTGDRSAQHRRPDGPESPLGDALTDGMSMPAPGTGSPAATPGERDSGSSVADAAAEAERALAQAARDAEQAVRDAHSDGSQAVQKGYADAQRATERAYEEASAKNDRLA
ncbi:hypothetical protein [Actinomycetospora lemnae]|uniref:Uncharacterized protein n=1 Tax=Actinomycetospora lemnae TaxID=3019891 RepID=A0ABT5STZ1_9PSEU|nr:hypothetical protein [Actinomycetospora sp. DW7H6]MDD7966326.1 hypothetical protein [Actinomycetospora sp. DW7H6]